MPNTDEKVHVRTSASAEDFWSRVRDPREVSPVDFRVPPLAKQRAAVDRDTPFGRQQAPFADHVPRPPVRNAAPLANTRIVERLVYRRALAEIDAPRDNARATEDALRREMAALTAQNAKLRAQRDQALRINHVLTGAMVRGAQEP